MLSSLFISGTAMQIADADHAERTANRAERIASDVRTNNESIQFDIEKLFMITEALWIILKEQHGYDDEHLVHMIRDIDLRDGKLDGKVAKSAERLSCPKCGRSIIRRKARCLYCGAAAPQQQPFER